DLQPQVVVVAGGEMVLHDQPMAGLDGRSLGLRRRLKIALGAIGVERGWRCLGAHFSQPCAWMRAWRSSIGPASTASCVWTSRFGASAQRRPARANASAPP